MFEKSSYIYNINQVIGQFFTNIPYEISDFLLSMELYSLDTLKCISNMCDALKDCEPELFVNALSSVIQNIEPDYKTLKVIDNKAVFPLLDSTVFIIDDDNTLCLYTNLLKSELLYKVTLSCKPDIISLLSKVYECMSTVSFIEDYTLFKRVNVIRNLDAFRLFYTDDKQHSIDLSEVFKLCKTTSEYNDVCNPILSKNYRGHTYTIHKSIGNILVSKKDDMCILNSTKLELNSNIKDYANAMMCISLAYGYDFYKLQ